MSKNKSLFQRILARGLVDHLVRHGYVPSQGLFRDLCGYALQSRVLKVSKKHPLYEFLQEPASNSFALSSTTLVWLWSYLCKTQPECIVEMGSGRSTVVFALYAKKQVEKGKMKPKVISIDSGEGWIADAREKLYKYKLADFVDFMHCRLIDNPDASNNAHGYIIDYELLNQLLENRKINLLLIDGPSGGLGRGATLPSLKDKLEKHADIFLDDACREPENMVINKWLHNYKNNISLRGILPFNKGFAWLYMEEKTES